MSELRANELPTGQVTFRFTDIEGSTQLMQSHPEAMKTALVRHHALLQGSIDAHNGRVFQVTATACARHFRAPTMRSSPRSTHSALCSAKTGAGWAQCACAWGCTREPPRRATANTYLHSRWCACNDRALAEALLPE